MTRICRSTALVLLVVAVTGCATGRAMRNAQAAVRRSDYDSAVVYYRQALANDPGKVDIRIQLERATRLASSEHIKRARELESQDQLAGALAEYKLAADLDTTNTLALSKAQEIERRMRAMAEAARPPARLDQIRQQAAQSSPIPRLNPRSPVPLLRFNNSAVRQVLDSISTLTGINWTYDRDAETSLSRPYTIDVQQISLEEALNQVLQANQLTFKVVNPQTIFVYQDTNQKRNLFEDQYTQTFYLSSADPTEIQTILTAMLPQNLAVRPMFSPNKAMNSLVVRATGPVLQVIENIIRQNDRPRPEVMIEAEILEVDRSFIRELGIDLNQYAIGFTFSPELTPPDAQSTANAFPSGPPPFNLNTLSQGTSAADFYLTSPTALIRILESSSKTKVLAKTQLRGRDGTPMTLLLGDSVAIPTTTFGAAAAGGVASIPTTSVTYQPVGVNLLFTPRVTYQDEVILDALTLEKSALGLPTQAGGQSFPSITTRRAQGALRLRDGESNLIAGLLRDDDRTSQKSLPGLTGVPILRTLFGNNNREVSQTDVVMIITPRIIRGHELSPEDLRPQYVGTGQNFATSPTPPLISPSAIGVDSVPAPGQPSAPANALPPPGTPGPSAPAPGPSTPPTPPRAPGVVPIQPVPPPAGAVESPGGPVRVTIVPPSSGEAGLQSGGGPYTVPITISGAPELQAISLTVTYNPAVLKTPTVTQGSFMMQTGASTTFVPRVNADDGRIDLVMSRPAGQGGASNAGLLAAIAFTGGYPGLTDISITGVATAVNGRAVSLEFTPTQVVVR